MSLKIVIIGAGEVGYNLASTLAREEHDITVIDIDPEKCDRIKKSIDARTIEGDGASQRIIQQIDAPEVDILLALTRIDEVNLVASRMAKKLGVKKVIARLRNTEYEHKNAIVSPEQFGIDFVVYPEKAAQNEIELLIHQSASVEIQEFKNGKITMVGIKLEPSSPLIGRSVRNVELTNPFVHHKLVGIVRKEDSFIPHQGTKYRKGDLAFFVGKTGDIKKIQQMAGKPAIDINNIMILGGGKICRLLAKSLQNDYDIRIIEKDKKKANILSMKLSNVMILNDSGTNIEFLDSERISEVDCFVALTENEQTNIISSLLAKHLGVKLVITHIITSAYLPVVRRIGVDAVVSKNISAVNEVIKCIRSNPTVSITRFEDIDVESMEIKISSESKYLHKNYSIEKIPEDITLGAVLRNGSIEIPNTHTVIQPGDDLLLFTKPAYINKAENLFK